MGEPSLVEAWQYARRVLSAKRLSHTEGTEREARRLAPLFGVDPEKAALAAILHDIARDLGPRELLRAAESKGIMVRTVDRLRPVLLHGEIAASEAARLGVADREVLRAISSHVTGRPGWTGLEQVLFLADKIEPGRDYPGVDRVRELVRRGRLKDALKQALGNHISFALRDGHGLVDPKTVVVFNEVSQGSEEAPDR